ncbi:MAG: ABC transporter permease [Anaeroplasmataceae bacterium]|nr:ABC transporter permease [Anaeroplasmataceae bacterium]
MQVCRLFFKITKKNIGFIILYLCIFSVMTVLMFTNINGSEGYTEDKAVAYIEVEENTADSSELISFLNYYVERKDLAGADAVDDALFWNDIDVFIKIPKDFYEQLLEDKLEILVIKTSPDSLSSYSLMTTIQSYFNQVKENIRLKLCSEENALSYTKEKIINTSLEINLIEKNNNLLNSMFNLGIYVICSLILMLVGIISFEMRTRDLARRLNISPVSTGKRNIVLALCYCGMSILIVGLITLIGIILFSDILFPKLGYFVLNMSIFAITMVFMALFISSFFKSAIAFNCVAVILPLAAAFICGSFVDLSFMPDYTQILGHVLPNIYIVKANAYINTCSSFNFMEYLKIVWPCFLFIAIFLVGNILISNFFAKSEN